MHHQSATAAPIEKNAPIGTITKAQEEEAWRNFVQVSQSEKLKLLAHIQRGCKWPYATLLIYEHITCRVDWEGRATFTPQALADTTGIAYTTVSRSLAWLDKNQYIKLERVGKQTSGCILWKMCVRRGGVPKRAMRASTGRRSRESAMYQLTAQSIMYHRTFERGEDVDWSPLFRAESWHHA